MVFKPFEKQVLGELCSKDQLNLLNAVDRLRSQGIDHYVSLPQIIVCGDQSSGKSSVLEAISGVSFPVKSNLCTRFPTELILRKTPNVGLSVSIVPDRSHSKAERASLRDFRQTLDSFDQLPDLIESAKTAMAIGTFGRAFSKDLLRIEVSGPDRPHLTIVDLPGLIHSETKHQSATDVELVQDVVNSYMKESRSIILAVVSAKNDIANQIVLKLARTADKTGNRTLGVITKPDTLTPGSDSENMYISLAQNLDVELRLGWHVLRNLDSEAGPRDLSARDDQENSFFSQGKWRTLPGSILGIAELRERLSKLLLAQIATELPSLVDEIEAKSAACRSQLQKLGEPRVNVQEQRLYLLAISQTCQTLTKAAIDGTYNDAFFGSAKTELGYQKRIRAVIQNLNQSFAETMAREGHRYVVDGSEKTIDAAHQSAITRAKYLDHIEDLMKRTRGRELIGTFSPMIVSELFSEQSQPWEQLVQSHIAKVTDAVRVFLRHLAFHASDASTFGPLFRGIIKPALETIVDDLKRKIADLLRSHQRGHPVTYNHYFTETVQNVRKERMRTDVVRVINRLFGVEPPGLSKMDKVVDLGQLLDALMDCNEPDMNKYACSEALDCLQAYYKVARKRFVDDIAVEAIEKHIMEKLGDVLSAMKVVSLVDKVVTDIAGESEESRARRKALTNQLDVLVDGLKTCKTFMGARLKSTQDEMIRDEVSEAPSPALSFMSLHTSLDEQIDLETSDGLLPAKLGNSDEEADLSKPKSEPDFTEEIQFQTKEAVTSPSGDVTGLLEKSPYAPKSKHKSKKGKSRESIASANSFEWPVMQ